jgi:serine/threonine-protein phosphatase 6 regulatory ankyrin repeat subunit C
MNKLWVRLPREARKLINAISHNPNIEQVKQLIASGTDISVYTPKVSWSNQPVPARYTLLHLAVYMNNLQTALLILNMFIIEGLSISPTDSNGDTPLHIAVKYCCRKIAKELVDKGADITARNKNGSTPFLLACQSSNWATTRYLLANGADINDRDNIGRGCLFYAARSRYDNVARKLLHRLQCDAEAAVNQEDIFGLTPLHLASHSNINLLSKSGADVNKQDNEGRTPMHWTIIQHRQWIINNSRNAANLIRNGADLNIQNNDGQSAISILANRPEILRDIIDILDMDEVYHGLIAIRCLHELLVYHLLDCDSSRDLFQYSGNFITEAIDENNW